jgi:adenylosuccinate synthase
MNEAIERMNKKVIISLNEYLELENIKKCHEENMKVIHGKVIIPPEDLERYKAIEHNWNELKRWLEDENNQKYSQYIYNYSINNWVLNKMQELEEGGNNER